MQKTVLISLIILLFSCSGGKHKNIISTDVKNEIPDSTNIKYVLKIGKNNIFQDSLIKESHFRGLQITKTGVALISGSNNLALEYGLKRKHWYKHRIGIPRNNWYKTNLSSHDNMEFRDIHNIKWDRHFVLSIQKPAKIIEYCNMKEVCFRQGESNFWINYQNTDTLCFLDGMDFWNDSIGIVFGDPLDGYPFILKTINGGTSWNRIKEKNLPKSLELEAGFAASGTSIVCFGNGIGYIGLGGEQARIFKTTDYGDSWEAINTCMLQGESGTGIYSVAFKDELNGVAVGGNWENTSCMDSKIYTNDGGLTWKKGKGIQEYRSCVTHWKNDIYISTGTSGTDISYDNGTSWQMLDTLGFNAIAFTKSGVGIGVGNKGLIRKINLALVKE